MRSRRASANRIFGVLKAALNLAFREGHAASDEAWRRVKPFREASALKIRYLQHAPSPPSRATGVPLTFPPKWRRLAQPSPP